MKILSILAKKQVGEADKSSNPIRTFRIVRTLPSGNAKQFRTFQPYLSPQKKDAPQTFLQRMTKPYCVFFWTYIRDGWYICSVQLDGEVRANCSKECVLLAKAYTKCFIICEYHIARFAADILLYVFQMHSMGAVNSYKFG